MSLEAGQFHLDMEMFIQSYSKAEGYARDYPISRFAGTTFNAFRGEDKNEFQPDKRPDKNWFRRWYESRFNIGKYLRQERLKKEKKVPHRNIQEDGKIEEAGEALARRYWLHVEAVAATARAIEVSPLLYWQPMVYSKKTLSEGEEILYAEKPEDSKMKQQLHDSWYSKVIPLVGEHPDFYDMSKLFDDSAESAFSDGRHYLPTAQKKMALRIASDIRALEAKKEPSPTGVQGEEGDESAGTAEGVEE